MQRIVLATGNPGKIREIRKIFADMDCDIVPQSDWGLESPEETGTTFAENALIKARHAAAQTGLPAMADDSGLVVDALDGRPGVYSARYAGEDATDDENLDRLLHEMTDVPEQDRGAAFHCAAVLAFAEPERAPLVADGEWRGTILRARRGTGGFGYDPVFLDPASGRTGAELSREEKNTVSHRGKAFRALRNLLQDAPTAGS